MTSIGPMNIVVYSRNETNVPADSAGPAVPSSRGIVFEETPQLETSWNFGANFTQAFRLGLCRATQLVIHRSLDLIGVGAPDRM